jgi:3D-(3,5/4)-trihydroxycyclohexane-1,2-dione acylhydrolase (decyclizing)
VAETDRAERVPSYESWWDVPVAELSAMEPVRAARAAYDEMRRRERAFL